MSTKSIDTRKAKGSNPLNHSECKFNMSRASCTAWMARLSPETYVLLQCCTASACKVFSMPKPIGTPCIMHFKLQFLCFCGLPLVAAPYNASDIMHTQQGPFGPRRKSQWLGSGRLGSGTTIVHMDARNTIVDNCIHTDMKRFCGCPAFLANNLLTRVLP